jgi:cold shock protein
VHLLPHRVFAFQAFDKLFLSLDNQPQSQLCRRHRYLFDDQTSAPHRRKRRSFFCKFDQLLSKGLFFEANSICQRKEIVMATGTVKWFNSTKGYGFIQPDDGTQDVFVHVSAVERAGMNGLKDGQKINYELVQDRRSGKMSADNLQA